MNLIAYEKKNEMPSLLNFFIDAEEAFDWVGWGFLKRDLNKKFGSRFIT